jgi:hypothetical protein
LANRRNVPYGILRKSERKSTDPPRRHSDTEPLSAINARRCVN